MQRFKAFVGDILEWFCVVLPQYKAMLGGGSVFVVAAGTYHLCKGDSPKVKEVVTLLVICFFSAAFAAWREEHRRCISIEAEAAQDGLSPQKQSQRKQKAIRDRLGEFRGQLKQRISEIHSFSPDGYANSTNLCAKRFDNET